MFFYKLIQRFKGWNNILVFVGFFYDHRLIYGVHLNLP